MHYLDILLWGKKKFICLPVIKYVSSQSKFVKDVDVADIEG